MEIEHKLKDRLTRIPRRTVLLTSSDIEQHIDYFWLCYKRVNARMHLFLIEDASRFHCTLSDFFLVFCIKYLCLLHCIRSYMSSCSQKKIIICFSPSQFHFCIFVSLKSRWILYSTPFLLLLFSPSSTSCTFCCLQEILPKMYFPSFVCIMMT